MNGQVRQSTEQQAGSPTLCHRIVRSSNPFDSALLQRVLAPYVHLMDKPPGLPERALSVRQPWAWAIIFGGKTIENRSLGSIRAGHMDCRRIAIHAAKGMSEKEYRWGVHKLHEHGVQCPWPADLPRSAIIGSVDVVDIISQSDSPWFGSRPGNHGLVLENPEPCDPIPVKGALGYFAWQPGGDFAPSAPWMTRYSRTSLFDDLPISFKEPPPKPFGQPKPR